MTALTLADRKSFVQENPARLQRGDQRRERGRWGNGTQNVPYRLTPRSTAVASRSTHRSAPVVERTRMRVERRQGSWCDQRHARATRGAR